jgi:methionyl-tRNA formyltransferase
MRIVFFGSGEFGLPTLRALRERHEVVAVVSQPDRPAGRGGKLTPTPIAAYALESMPGVPLVREEDVNVPEVRERVRGFAADAWVVIAFGQKLSKELLDGKFAINLHGSLLPRWRGAAPINRAILAGDAEAGNSVITLAERMDAGLVLGESRRRVPPEMTAGELHDALSADGPEVVLRVLSERAAGTERGVSQDAALVTKAAKLSRADGWVDFSQSAEECRRRINGLSPWPGVSVKFRGEPFKLVRGVTGVVTGVVGAGRGGLEVTGSIVDPEQGLVATSDGVLKLLEVQPPGKRAMSWGDFARGARVKAGEVLAGGREAC